MLEYNRSYHILSDVSLLYQNYGMILNKEGKENPQSFFEKGYSLAYEAVELAEKDKNFVIDVLARAAANAARYYNRVDNIKDSDRYVKIAIKNFTTLAVNNELKYNYHLANVLLLQAALCIKYVNISRDYKEVKKYKSEGLIICQKARRSLSIYSTSTSTNRKNINKLLSDLDKLETLFLKF